MNTPSAAPSVPQSPLPLRISQKRFGARTFFEFGEESVRHGHDDGSASRTYTIEYAELSQDRETFVDRNTWWRNVGLVWAGLGAVLTAMAWADHSAFRPSIWLPLGAICLVVYALRIRRYTVIPAQRCNVLIIDDAQAPTIVAELDRRRAAQLRDRFDYLSPDESLEQQRHRVLWLQRQGSLDSHEVSARLLQLDLMAQTQDDGPEGERE